MKAAPLKDLEVCKIYRRGRDTISVFSLFKFLLLSI